jgi:mRNA-degrading endonuclease RelE of RelBE toxin-antitoxin system
MVVSYSEAFKQQIRRLGQRYRRIRSDVEPLLNRLEAGETPGDRMQYPDHVLYKVRVKNTDALRGKSGGYRVIYYQRTSTDLLLVAIYSKSEQSDIARHEVLRIITGEG